jgi:hypothetical protein
MRRLEDWPERLAAYLDSRRDAPFQWGETDCATFAAGCVLAVTGESLDLPAVASADGYLRLLRDHGPLATLVGERLGDPLPSPAFAQRGDVVLMTLEGRETLGVCIGAEVAGPGPGGMVTMPMSIAAAAWRV